MKLSFPQLMAGLCLGIALACQAQVDVTGIDHVAIRVTSLETSAKWYEARFGFRKLQEWKGVWMIGKGNVRIGLFLVDKPKPIDDFSSRLVIEHYAFGVSGDRFQTAIDQLRASGVTLSEVEDTGIAYSVFMNDPDGHQIEMTTYHGKVRSPPK
jgi:catechol 2,3-dioxygenase-like lactoylglutathione lyase family enzyme